MHDAEVYSHIIIVYLYQAIVRKLHIYGKRDLDMLE